MWKHEVWLRLWNSSLSLQCSVKWLGLRSAVFHHFIFSYSSYSFAVWCLKNMRFLLKKPILFHHVHKNIFFDALNRNHWTSRPKTDSGLSWEFKKKKKIVDVSAEGFEKSTWNYWTWNMFTFSWLVSLSWYKIWFWKLGPRNTCISPSPQSNVSNMHMIWISHVSHRAQKCQTMCLQ